MNVSSVATITTCVASSRHGNVSAAAYSASSEFSSQIGFCVVGPVGPSPGLRLFAVYTVR